MLSANRSATDINPPRTHVGSESIQSNTARNIIGSRGIDFVVVAESHVLMFSRMKDYIYGEIQDVSVIESIVRSDTCQFGNWLNGDGKVLFGQLASFDRLYSAHAEFHECAASVLDTMEAGSWIAAERVLKQDFSRSLRRILIALTELNETVINSRNDSLRTPAWAVS